MNSILLEPALEEMLLADCRDFLCSEAWYVSCFRILLNTKVYGVYRYAERGEFL